MTTRAPDDFLRPRVLVRIQQKHPVFRPAEGIIWVILQDCVKDGIAGVALDALRGTQVTLGLPEILHSALGNGNGRV